MTSTFQTLQMTRRRFHAGGATLLAAGLAGGTVFDARAQAQPQVAAQGPIAKMGVISKGGAKPTFLPEPGSRDPVAHSQAEHLFWNEQLMEHAVFFYMLMPGGELAQPRAQVENFRATFTNLLAQSKKELSKATYAAVNRATVEHVKRFVEFKHKMRDEQTAGKLKSLVWPTFFDHTAREAEHFIARLNQLSRGDVSLDQKATVAFWAEVMGDHADFIAHLLDPAEFALVKKAMATSEAFKKLPTESPITAKEAAMRAVDEIIDFKVAAATGIETGKIKSIIHPVLADHVRREAMKAADELARAV